MARTEAEAAQAILMVADAIVEAVAEGGEQGVPSGFLYMALMPIMDIHVYTTFIKKLVDEGRLVANGDILRVA